MRQAMARLVCSGCGYVVAESEPCPFRCPRALAGDDVDHVLTRDLRQVGAGARADARRRFLAAEPNPFLRYRSWLRSYQVARQAGLADREYVDLVRCLDAAVAAVDGKGFRETPFAESRALGEAVGAGTLWVKDETGNVAGSHKARHLMAVALWLEVADRLGWTAARRGRLAAASCGNAALAAGVLARAVGRPLEVFVPTWVHPPQAEALRALGVELTTCRRRPGGTGDPCYQRFRREVDLGGVPFSCQGSDNGLSIEGGLTLAWEMVSRLLATGRRLDRLVVQVGGGALASACSEAFAEAAALGLVERPPRLHAVQTRGASPLVRAYDLVVDRVLERSGAADPGGKAGRAERAARLAAAAPADLVEETLDQAAEHRSRFMWAWEKEPRSLADGILDDETYDWMAIVRGMLATGGYPLVASEADLAAAHRLARERTDLPVSPTGTAGLAGCLKLARRGEIGGGESVAVLFTGADLG